MIVRYYIIVAKKIYLIYTLIFIWSFFIFIATQKEHVIEIIQKFN